MIKKRLIKKNFCLSDYIIPRKKRICLVGATCNDPALNAAAQQFKVSVLKSETGTEYVEDTTYYTYFVLKQFEGSEYYTLCKTPHRLVYIIIYYILMMTFESIL